MQRNLKIVSVTLLLIALSQGIAAKAQERTHTGKIPFTAMTRHGGPIITVRLNNTTDARFLIDTGSGSSGISQTLADRMKLKRERKGGGMSMSILAVCD